MNNFNKMQIDNDFELVEKFVSGDETAFNLLVRKYQKKIYWHARQMLGDHHDADEITQEVLIVMYNKLKTFGFKSSLYTWIYKIVSTRSLNQIRRKKLKRLVTFDTADEKEFSSKHDIIQDIANRDKLEKVNNALDKLPAKQRQIFVMRNYDQLSYEEISEITGKSVGGLKANYFHALKKILELVNEKD
ncbi:MAG: RNA polymerase sigma factor [Melioribacteraceae bacterium]|nr:RNA polymerase sigma factor [Melioribacteraceae bacterium]